MLKLHSADVMASIVLLTLLAAVSSSAAGTELWREGINIIPTPQVVRLGEGEFRLDGPLEIAVSGQNEEDVFAARDLADELNARFGIRAEVVPSTRGRAIELIRAGVRGIPEEQAYRIEVDPERVRLISSGAEGLFYATRSLLQLIGHSRQGLAIPGMLVEDWPDIKVRAVHYDTKHHQDRLEYLRSFIRDLADYKINMLIWEWEDKFAYRSHPEVGAPGAFTAEQIRELAEYARRYHVQIVPLIQGLGHVSYILKHPVNRHLREIPASNWEFCPLKEGSYRLLFDLWDEAMEATPGSEYLHIGSDETFELGRGTECSCAEKVAELGTYSFYMQFVNRCAAHVVEKGRKFIAWTPAYNPQAKIKPLRQGPLMAEGLDLTIARKGKEDGYAHWVYTPNPGLEEPFLPYFYRENNRQPGTTLEESFATLTTAARSGLYEGMIVASWDDSGLHNQVWMMRFIEAAEYAWSGLEPELDEFTDKYFTNYYGPRAKDMQELFTILSRATYYFMDSFERKIWHWGEIGKTRIPDLPRGDAIEFDPFWTTEYREMLDRSRIQLRALDRARGIILDNRGRDIRHVYDLDVFGSIIELIAHNARTYLALSELEKAVQAAHRARFVNHTLAVRGLEQAVRIVNENLEDRARTFDSLVAVWEKSRLPKGMSTPEKKYLWSQDRARHFANRRPDMTYLICNEEMLGLENYVTRLSEYIAWYKETFSGELK